MINAEAFKIGLRLHAHKHMPGVVKIGKVDVSKPVTEDELDIFVQVALPLIAKEVSNSLACINSEVRIL